ncbi:ThiF family adenylyltransferase [Candidatus Odyssella acanthamoebae]|uniref:ThiF family adenylyltransferase n=1 Tax=Candidatus Odyssella acanthamoebae TaxID=91604 RepID=UPI00068A0382|nr:ThiF family adenylyltransferase [Candidatus Paracaedibacter acanthamoebae]
MVSVSLATSGIGTITLLDFDEIETSNLTRQFMFSLQDIGLNKADVLKRELLKRSTSTQVDIIKERLSQEVLKSIERPDLIVLSADSLDCIPIVNSYAVKNGVPYINIGYIQDIAVWGPFVIPGKTGCFYCQQIIANDNKGDTELKEKVKRINAGHQAPSNPSVNMLASALGAMDIIKFLGDFGKVQSLNKRVGLWTNSLKIETQDCTLNPNCKICSQSLRKQAR